MRPRLDSRGYPTNPMITASFGRAAIGDSPNRGKMPPGSKWILNPGDLGTTYIHPPGFEPVNQSASNLGDHASVSQGDSDTIAVSLGGGPTDGIENSVGNILADELEANIDVSDVTAKVVVEVIGSADPGVTDAIAAVLASELLGQGSGSSQSISMSGDEIVVVASIPTGNGEMLTATARISSDPLSPDPPSPAVDSNQEGIAGESAPFDSINQ